MYNNVRKPLGYLCYAIAVALAMSVLTGNVSAAEPTDVDAAVTWAGTIWTSLKVIIIGIVVITLGKKLLKKVS